MVKKIGKNQMSKRKNENEFKLVIHYASEEESKSKEYHEEELIKWFELVLKEYSPKADSAKCEKIEQDNTDNETKKKPK
jgi:hypothetical protein